MTLARTLEPEWLDELPAEDARAMRSRRDLRRINALMMNSVLVARELRRAFPGKPPRIIAEVGAGDGHFMLQVANKLPQWRDVNAILLDQQPVLSPATRDKFAAIGWLAQTVAADAGAWLAQPPAMVPDVIVANLFLHHFDTAGLAELLRQIARRTRVLIACEPRRSRCALLGSHMLALIGCNDVTRHDAVVSVRAGFRNQELSGLWPDHAAWTLREHAYGLFSHCFVAIRAGKRRRPCRGRPHAMKSYDALVIGAGPAGATAALMLARAGWSVALVERAPFPRRKVCGEFMSATCLPLLREFGLAGAYLAQAGPPVRQVGLYAGETMLAADMPCPRDGADLFGHALGREHFDTLLLNAAAESGAEVWQPWTLTDLSRRADGYTATAVAKGTRESAALGARVVIAAHGSWEPGGLPTQVSAPAPRDSDLFAFKAHYFNCGLPAALMPLLLFPGGYGGMVHSDGGRVSLSCCIRRDMLARCRREWPHTKAADAVIAHIRAASRGVENALAGATRDADWLSAGPIRPGIRAFRGDGIFAVGNAAGEAHPLVAEGISMAIQSSWLLCGQLIANRRGLLAGLDTATVARDYASSWRRNFARRVHAAAIFANLATRPLAAALAPALLARAPSMLTFAASVAGKAQWPILAKS